MLEQRNLKEALIGWLSSLFEAYNMAVYPFTAALIAPYLFKGQENLTALFFSYFLSFLGACFFYPLGALIYGRLGDLRGRRRLCTYSSLGLALATGLIGCVPFEGEGNLAWIVVLALLSAQHFFSGGEYHGSVVFSLEHMTKSRGGLTSSLCCLFAVAGLLAANGLAAISDTFFFCARLLLYRFFRRRHQLSFEKLLPRDSRL